MYTIDRDILYKAVREIARRIENCGASPELTHASSLACDLASAIGNEYNEPNPYMLCAILEELKKSE